MSQFEPLPHEELIRACTQPGEAAAWEEFIHRFHPVIAATALRTARRWGENPPQVLDDLIQETYLKLCADGCRLLVGFHPQHPDAIFGFLKVVTANVVHDHFKGRRARKRNPGESPASNHPGEITAGPAQAGAPERIEREVLLREIDAALHAAAGAPGGQRDCRIFWLYYRQGFTARAIAALPTIALTTKGVESVLLRLTCAVRAALVARRGSTPTSKLPLRPKREGIYGV